MPYKNYHSCSIRQPNYDKYAYEKCATKHDNKCIDFIYGIRKDKKSELQALRYKKSIWSVSDARKHCKSHEGTFEAAKNEDISDSLDKVKEEYINAKKI